MVGLTPTQASERVTPMALVADSKNGPLCDLATMFVVESVLNLAKAFSGKGKHGTGIKTKKTGISFKQRGGMMNPGGVMEREGIKKHGTMMKHGGMKKHVL